MRTARTIGIAPDGTEKIIHPATTPIVEQLESFRGFADKLPKEFDVIAFQPSDGPQRLLRAGINAGLKDAEERAEAKAKHAEKWHKQQADTRAAKEKAEADERQKHIDAANAAKEAAKKSLLAGTKPTITTQKPK